jgi:hypothetical protein
MPVSSRVNSLSLLLCDGSWLNVWLRRLSIFRIFDPRLFSLSKGGKGLIHSKAFKHAFTVFTVRYDPTAGLAHGLSCDFDMMVFVVYFYAFQVLTTSTRLSAVKNAIAPRYSHGILIIGGCVLDEWDGAVLCRSASLDRVHE